MPIKPFEWKDRCLTIIDQTRLPQETVYIRCMTVKDVFDAIKMLKVRGAPLIGIIAAYGILVALQEQDPGDAESVKKAVQDSAEYLKSSRPTAVNLEWAVKRMEAKALSHNDEFSAKDLFQELEQEADAIYREDYEMSRKIGEYGNTLIKEGATILTHCNAGGLATSGLGTALSPIYLAADSGKKITVYVDETRPLLQGARLTSYELTRHGIHAILISDSMAGFVMSQGKIDLVIIGADRIAGNGDTANKIGSLSLGILCHYFQIPFYVAAPSTTFDLSLASGQDIPIEQRDPMEIRSFAGIRTAPDDVPVYNPAFDVTDHSLITGFFTDRGIIYPPYKKNLTKALMS